MMLSEPASLQNISLEGGPWNNYTEQDRLEDVDRSEILVDVLDVPMRSAISTRLRYKSKFLGRGMIRPLRVGDVSLIIGDRLEPDEHLRDVSDFEGLQPPFRVKFWRCFSDDRVIHDSPLFLVPGLGIDTQGPDTLHGWALGPVLAFIPVALWFLIGSSVYTPGIEGLSTEDCAKIAMLRIKQKLWEHYKIKRTDPRWKAKGSEVWNLTLAMLGKKKNPHLSIKAAEAKGLLEFVKERLTIDVPKLNPGEKMRGLLFLAGAESAWKVELSLRTTGSLTYTPAERQQLLTDYTHHVVLFHRAGGLLKPKHHMFFHLILDSSWRGVPSLWTTFRDESLNGVIAGIARSCHRNRFGEVIHFKFSALKAMAGPSAMQMH
jgi:hypothetical protein